MKLYRPVGLVEMTLIYESGMREFPPRLPEQPIFYPVLNFEYAEQISRDWNTKEPPYAGYVTEFEINDTYISKFEPKIVGDLHHVEYWIPAEKLTEFNSNLSARINVTAAYFGSDFQGYIPQTGWLRGLEAVNQLIELAEIDNNVDDALLNEILENHKTIFLNYPFWVKYEFKQCEISMSQKKNLLKAIWKSWVKINPGIMLLDFGFNPF